MTPFTDILASTYFSVTGGVSSGGYCSVSFGFGIPPRAPVAAQSMAFASRGMAIGAGAVPEPASWAMLLLGFGMVGTVARRRNTAVAA